MTAVQTTPSPSATPRVATRAVPWQKVGAIVAGVLVVGWLWSRWTGGAEAGNAIAGKDLHQVERGSFNIVIPVSGELAAVRQVEIRNKLEGRAVITSIVDEGSQVRAGDVVVRLADEEIKQKIQDGEDKLKSAQSELVAAEQKLGIQRSTRESELEKADLDIELATLALKAWEEGEVIAKREELALARQTAEINAKRLEERFAEAARLVEQEFLSRDEYEQDRIEMIEAQAKVRQAELAQFLYDNFEHRQEEAKKRSDLDQAVAERARVEQRNDAEIVQFQAQVESKRFALQTQQDRLADFKRQLDACTIVAPIDGLLVYASSIEEGRRRMGGGDAPPPAVGTELRPNELVAILPDVSEMVALLKVSEAMSGRIEQGQAVTVYSDALPNVPLRGEVQSVSVLAESGGWRDPNRRDYTVRVLLDTDPTLGLKPAMRCRAEIMLDRVEDGLWVPIQSVYREGPVAYVYVAGDDGLVQRQITLGRSGELQVELKEGIEAGEQVLLRRPSADEVAVRIPAEVFEAAKSRASESAPGRQARREGAGRPGGPPNGRSRGPQPPATASGGDAAATSTSGEATAAAPSGTTTATVPAQQ